MAWLQLRVHTKHPEFAEEVLLAHGASAVSFIDARDNPVLEPAPGATPLWTNTATLGLFADQTDLAPVVASLQEFLPEGAALQTESGLVEDRDWVRVWLKDCPPIRFGGQDRPGLWVVPRERAQEVQEPGTVVQLDPGLAFGTGTHPSTALCLDWIADQDLEGKKVLDYGCGSGILAIAALKRGAARAVCADIDAQALTAARDNAAVNGVAGRLVAMGAGDDFYPFPADVVLANILANPLRELAPLLSSSIRPGGTIVLAGLLADQAADVRDAYEAWFDFDPVVLKEGWARLSGRCRMPAMINELKISDALTTAGQPQVDHLRQLAESGFDAVINLAPSSSINAIADERDRLQAHGLRYVHIPVKWEAPSAENLQEFFSAMEELPERKVFVHCAMNKRVSAFVFLHRVLHQNMAPEIASRDLLRIWNPNPVWTTFIERMLAERYPGFRVYQ